MPSLLSGYEEQRAPTAPAFHDDTKTFYVFLQESTTEGNEKLSELKRNNLKQNTELVITHDPFTLRLSNGDTCSTACVTVRPQLLPSGNPNDNHRAQ
jgi:hypothetical protein